jgi:type I restriction enzyme S subunit
MWFVDDYLFEWKTLVIWRVGTHWIIQIFYDKIYPSDNTLVIKSDNFYFTYFILRHVDYERLNRWAVQPLITQWDLNNYWIILPTKDVLEKFNLTSNSIFTKIKTNSEEIESLSKTRDQLLPKLMSWEVRVEF